jgi:hypothetical protein
MGYAHLKAANELIGALVMGLWNRLTRHQERAFPPHVRGWLSSHGYGRRNWKAR